jgi:DNA invertase Pin-like site-specific DNA recombinase
MAHQQRDRRGGEAGVVGQRNNSGIILGMTTLNDLNGRLTAVIYTRKSTASDGKSTRDQERECRAWCDQQDIPVEEVFCDEGISASRYGKKIRSSWAAVKAYLRPGHILVCWESSRTARDLGEHINLRNLCSEHGVPLAYNGRIIDFTSSDDRFNAALDAMLAERESDRISERTLRGIRGALVDGTPHARPPWGYRRTGQRGQWDLDPVEAPRVREAAERVLAGESRRAVLRWLQSTGNAPASPSSFNRVLTNPQIAGQRVHRGKAVGKGTWEPIITLDQHRQLVAASVAGTVSPGPESKHLCSGIVKCGKCGRGVHYKIVAKGRKPLYACQRGCASRLAAIVDAEVEAAVLRRLANIDPADYSSESPEMVAAIRRIEELEAELAKFKAGAIAGDIDYDVYAGREKTIKAEIHSLRPRTVARTHDKPLTPENWKSGTLQERREVVRKLFDVKLPGRGARGNGEPVAIDITPR